jgi:type I restriction enzyme S subunit
MQPETPVTEYVRARDYLFHFLTFSLRSMQESAFDTTVPRLGRDDILEVTVPLAPLEEELRIVERIRELFTRANEAEQSVNSALKNAELLEQSLFEKAFRPMICQRRLRWSHGTRTSIQS